MAKTIETTKNHEGTVVQEVVIESATDSIEIKEDAKGTPKVTVKCYGSDPEELRSRAVKQYAATQKDLRNTGSPY